MYKKGGRKIGIKNLQKNDGLADQLDYTRKFPENREKDM